MQNETTTLAALTNASTTPVSLSGLSTAGTGLTNQSANSSGLSAAVFYPVLWRNSSMSWDSYNIAWEDISDSATLTNL